MTDKELIIIEISKESVIELIQKGGVRIETNGKTFQIIVNPGGKKKN